jgi:hypothetical protein
VALDRQSRKGLSFCLEEQYLGRESYSRMVLGDFALSDVMQTLL